MSRGLSDRCRASASRCPTGASPPTARTRQAAIPAGSQIPTIGWPRCAVRASWWTQSGSVEGRRDEVDDEGQDHDGGDRLAGDRGPEQAADREADPGQAEGVEAEDRGAEHGRRDVATADRGTDRDAERDDDREGHDRRYTPSPPAIGPAAARQRRREERVQPAAGLVRRPARRRASPPRTRRG